MAANDDDPDVIAGRKITSGAQTPSGKAATTTPDDTDPDVVAGRKITAATPPPATASQPSTAAAAPPDTIAPETRAWLQPAPNTTYGSVLPLARDDTTGQLRFALPSSLRDLAIGGLDLIEGPATGGVTPAGTNALLTAAMGGAFNPAPTSARVAAAGARDVAAQAAKSPPPLPPGTNIGPVPPSAPPSGAPPGGAPPQATAAALPPGPGQPTGVPAYGVSVPYQPPATSEEGKALASAWFQKAEQAGATLTPQGTTKFLDQAIATMPQSEWGKAAAGENDTTAMLDRLNALRGQGASMRDVQEVDKEISDRIDNIYRANGGPNEDTSRLQKIQDALRDGVENAAPGDVSGDASGFAAWRNGQQAWSTAMRMNDLERMQYRANLTKDAANSFQTQMRTYLTGPRSRGLTDDQRKALENATPGNVGQVVRIFSDRFLPHVAAAVGATVGGSVGGGVGSGIGIATGEVAGHVVGAGARAAQNALAARRFNQALATAGRGAPPPPPGYVMPPTPLWNWGSAGPAFNALVPTVPSTAEQDYQNWRNPLLPST